MQAALQNELNFDVLKTAVAKQFQQMSKGTLYVTGTDKDALWEKYLSSFPSGTNPIYRKRTCHDGSYDRHFIHTIGNVVAIVENRLVSLWDIAVGATEPAYQVVADAMAEYVKSFPVTNEFLHYEASVGVDKSYENRENGVHTWTHFFVNLPPRFAHAKLAIPSRLSDIRAHHDVFARSLTELTLDAVDTVLDLIAQNSLYRGQEHEATLRKFRASKVAFDALPVARKDLMVWSSLATTPGAVSKIRNTSIGTLLVNLSEGMDLDEAVRKFEAVVAPANYKRPTALVTPKMVEQARVTLTELGLVSALDRRHATLDDVSVNDLIFVNRGAGKAEDDLFSAIACKTSAKTFGKVEDIPAEKFLTDVLPNATTVKLYLEPRHTGNLVTLIAPQDPTARQLFKWDNNFSWSYNGNLADSIKERVKKAGGNVEGDLCCRLSWHNYDDLDLHLVTPSGEEIYYAHKRSYGNGQLDVDMNAVTGTTREPVENIFFPSRATMPEGVYTLFVHNYQKREDKDPGFEVEIDYLGETTQYCYSKNVKMNEKAVVATFNYSRSKGLSISTSLPQSTAQKTMWGLKSHTFHPVEAIMLSPNFWGPRGTGNKHYIFALDGCQTDAPPRGFYNEFLRDDLTAHRKVIEILGTKAQVPPSDKQLSGLGFSSTQRNAVVAEVSGAFKRTVNITF